MIILPNTLEKKKKKQILENGFYAYSAQIFYMVLQNTNYLDYISRWMGVNELEVKRAKSCVTICQPQNIRLNLPLK